MGHTAKQGMPCRAVAGAGVWFGAGGRGQTRAFGPCVGGIAAEVRPRAIQGAAGTGSRVERDRLRVGFEVVS